MKYKKRLPINHDYVYRQLQKANAKRSKPLDPQDRLHELPHRCQMRKFIKAVLKANNVYVNPTGINDLVDYFEPVDIKKIREHHIINNYANILSLRDNLI